MDKSGKVYLGFRVSHDEAEKIREQAKKEERSLASFLRSRVLKKK